MPVGRTRRCENNIKKCIRGTGCQEVNWIELA
jgi:hypothetical protein